MTLRARACHISLDYSDGLCTSHGSHSREGSNVGLDTYGKTSSESTNPSVSQDLFPLGHGFMSRPGSRERTPQGMEKTSPQMSLGHAHLCWSCSWLPNTMRVSNGGAEPHPGAVGPGGDARGSPGLFVHGDWGAAGVPFPALRFPLGAPSPGLSGQHHPAPHRSPTLTSCGAGGRP